MAKREEKQALEIPEGSVNRILIVRAEFNSDITRAQLASATKLLQESGVEYDVVDVTGSFEIPHAIERIKAAEEYDGVIALGCLIKGESIHFEVIAYALAKQLMEQSVQMKTPIGFGVITALTREQAEERTWIGEDAAYAVLSSLV